MQEYKKGKNEKIGLIFKGIVLGSVLTLATCCSRDVPIGHYTTYHFLDRDKNGLADWVSYETHVLIKDKKTNEIRDVRLGPPVSALLKPELSKDEIKKMPLKKDEQILIEF